MVPRARRVSLDPGAKNSNTTSNALYRTNDDGLSINIRIIYGVFGGMDGIGVSGA